jgi:hypothetical protein
MQITGHELSRGELRRQKQLIRQLLVHHVRPLLATARLLMLESDVRMPVMRVPRANGGVTKLLQACDGMIDAARPFEAAFIASGLPAGFLARFKNARDELEQGIASRATLIGSHVGARVGLGVEIRRGRRAVDHLDAVVRAVFEDQVTLARWRVAKRVHLLRGAGEARSDAEAPLEQAA